MRLLHPTDFSQTSQAALAVARDLHAKLGGTLHIVHVQQRFESASARTVRPHLDSLNPQLTQRQEEERAEEVRRLREMLTHLASPDGTTELRWGEPVRELLDMQDQYDLVVMGAHGANRLDRFFLGGVAGRFVRRSRVPVVTVRDESTTKEVRRALVATDFGDASKNALEFARKLHSKGVRLMLCHVIDDVRVQEDPTYIHTATDALDLASKGVAERLLIREGDPVTVLPALAKEVGADLIVIGLRHHRAAAGLLLGSRADALIRSSAVPVLSVPHVTG